MRSGAAFPAMVADAVENLAGQGERITAVFAADTWSLTGLDALDEVLQLARQLIAAAAVQLQDLQMPAEQFVFQRSRLGRVELAEV